LKQDKVFSYIGLAMKSGNIACGEFSTEKAVKEGKAKLVLVAEDASNNTKKMFTNMCTYYKVPIYFFGEKSELGHSLGKEFRASLAVLDQGFANAVEKQLKIGGSKYGENENI
jgi:ribosomal protein L7Ae-like RNA K-turn-binding protein